VSLRSLALSFYPEGLAIRVMYRMKDSAGPNTKARAKEVAGLARAGLEQAVESLEGRVNVVDTSGYETREDTISADAARHHQRGRRKKEGSVMWTWHAANWSRGSSTP
jgi:hypothetical protein